MLNKYITLGVLILVGILSFTSSYTAPTYHSINFTLCSGYTAPTYDSINFTLGDSDACVAVDSCTYTSGNWKINCSDNCVIDSVVAVGGNDLIFTDTGTFYMESDVVGFGSLILSNGCDIILKDGVSLISN